MHRVQEYEQHAETAEANAERTLDPTIKQQFLDVAFQWRELARQARDLADWKKGI